MRRNGKLVLNEAIGIARGFRPNDPISQVQVQSQTPFPVLSAGKPLAAITIAMLEDRRVLDVNAPIAQIFPEFSRHGKERINALDVLSHRSGMLMPEFVKKTQLWGDRETVQEALIDTVPSYGRGTLAYHPHEYRWILSEIVLRVDGRSLPDFLVEEIALAKLYVLPIQSTEFTHPNSCVAKNTQDCPIAYALDRVLVRYSVKVQESLPVGNIFGYDPVRP